MIFDYSGIDLPIVEAIATLKKSLTLQNTCILSAPPGAGKSTLLPIVLLEEAWLAGKKIIVLEPRRLAAKSIAERLSSLLGESCGQTVGYRIRFETKISEKTRIEVVTEGILTRMLHSENTLSEFGLVIFDEFHERSIHADVSLALCREVQQILRPELRILIMSATLDTEDLSQKLHAPIIKSEGRQYPVKIKYVGNHDSRMIAELCARTIETAVKDEEGDVLVFLPGQGEIKKCEEFLKGKLRNCEIYPLYGQLPPAVQQRALQKNKEGKRKIVLATSIAETSLTIEGVGVVIDTGLVKSAKFDPNSGLSRLETHLISLDSATQRAGRAGRLGPGVCYRMWTPALENTMDAHRKPEIAEMDLASLALDLASWGVNDASDLFWLTPPPRGAYNQALELLHELEALENGKLTAHGILVHKVPCHPRLAHLLIKAEELNLLELATDVCAILEEKDAFYQQMGIDINLRIEALRRFRSSGNNHKMNKIERVAESYRKLFKVEIDNGKVDDYETGLLLTFAYPERIAYARPGNNSQFQLANGNIASFSHKDELANEAWLAVASLHCASNQMGNIFLASRINPTDLQPYVKKVENIHWDRKKGVLNASQDLRIGSIILQSKPLPNPNQDAKVKAICQVIKKEGEHLLNFDNQTISLINRVQSIRKWDPSLGLENISISNLCQTCETWLSPYLNQVKNETDLRNLNIHDILWHSIDYSLQKQIHVLAPEKILVPSGSSIPIVYQSNGESPILSVRLQECFGMTETPKVNLGKISLLIHLLSPGYKPVQITNDLSNFWKNTYFEVKKELKSRYPKHSWPENPLEAEAISGAKKRVVKQ